MNAKVFRPQVIEALTTLWRALPLRGVSDEAGVMDDYCYALSDCSSQAVWNTVNNLRSGKIEEASKDFCPKAPKLAEYVRFEQRRLDAINRPPAISYSPVNVPFKDWRIIHRQMADALKSVGWTLVAENLSLDDFTRLSKRRRWGAQTTWFWAIAEAWSPPAPREGE